LILSGIQSLSIGQRHQSLVRVIAKVGGRNGQNKTINELPLLSIRMLFFLFLVLQMPDHRALDQQSENNANWTKYTPHFPAFEELDVGHPNAMERQVQNISGIKYESR